MIRVAVLDDHPLLRAGLTTVLHAEPGLIPVGAAGDGTSFWPLLYRTRPDLVILDYHLPRDNSLALCHRLKQHPTPPAVLMYAAFADTSLGVLARLARADGVVDKASPASELLRAIRLVARGESALPPAPPQAVATVCRGLDADNQPLVGMLLHATPIHQIADALHEKPSSVARRIDRMLRDLAPESGPVAA
jgi:DNA-binding NarL/FixJ family response regulator